MQDGSSPPPPVLERLACWARSLLDSAAAPSPLAGRGERAPAARAASCLERPVESGEKDRAARSAAGEKGRTARSAAG
ncbi:hypothetical protein CDD83_5829 [Cordyceps sp. RAO-2017]|nr:hypothetical protein CDD83_5829 [Cordyceps sp. RAO-2017]